MTVKLGSLSSASPPITWNCTSASSAPPCRALTCVPRSSKKTNSVPSRGVVAAPPRVVAGERRARGRVEVRQLPRPGAIGLLVERRPRSVVGRSDDRLGIEDRDEVREVAVPGDERELRDERVGGVDRPLVDDTLQAGIAGLDEPVHRAGHVCRCEVAAVLPLDSGTELEGPDRAVSVRLPRLGKTRADVAIGLERGEELEALGDQRRSFRGPASQQGRADRRASASRP